MKLTVGKPGLTEERSYVDNTRATLNSGLEGLVVNEVGLKLLYERMMRKISHLSTTPDHRTNGNIVTNKLLDDETARKSPSTSN
jgi:hypothetical protein